MTVSTQLSTGFIPEETGKSGLKLGRAQCGQLIQILTLQLYTEQFSFCPNTVQMFGNKKFSNYNIQTNLLLTRLNDRLTSKYIIGKEFS